MKKMQRTALYCSFLSTYAFIISTETADIPFDLNRTNTYCSMKHFICISKMTTTALYTSESCEYMLSVRERVINFLIN